MTTSSTSVPSGRGLLQGQQKPATILAQFRFSRFRALISSIIADGLSKILNSILVSKRGACAGRMPSTLSSHCR
jgi:hypothetical protein